MRTFLFGETLVLGRNGFVHQDNPLTALERKLLARLHLVWVLVVSSAFLMCVTGAVLQFTGNHSVTNITVVGVYMLGALATLLVGNLVNRFFVLQARKPIVPITGKPTTKKDDPKPRWTLKDVKSGRVHQWLRQHGKSKDEAKQIVAAMQKQMAA